MRITLRELPEGHSRIDRTAPADELDLNPWFTPEGPVKVQLEVDKRDQQLTLRGRVWIQAKQTCARCLVEVVTELVSELQLFADRRGSDEVPDERALEQEGSILYHDGIELNLGASVRDALILEVSQVVLCREDCRGLCPNCGQNWNQADCTCSGSSVDSRWHSLKELKKSGSNQER